MFQRNPLKCGGPIPWETLCIYVAELITKGSRAILTGNRARFLGGMKANEDMACWRSLENLLVSAA